MQGKHLTRALANGYEVTLSQFTRGNESADNPPEIHCHLQKENVVGNGFAATVEEAVVDAVDDLGVEDDIEGFDNNDFFDSDFDNFDNPDFDEWGDKEDFGRHSV